MRDPWYRQRPRPRRAPFTRSTAGIHVHRVNPASVRYRLPGIGLKTRLPYKGLFKNAVRALFQVDTVWYTLINRFIRDLNLDVLHIHDLRLCPTGLSAARRLDLPVIADLHENYPALMAMLKGRNSPQKARKAYKKWRRVERDVVWDADAVITVIEEARDRLITKRCPRPKSHRAAQHRRCRKISERAARPYGRPAVSQ